MSRIVIKTAEQAHSFLTSFPELLHNGEVKGDTVHFEEHCHRCGGSGIWTQWHGACFECNGSGGHRRWTLSIIKAARLGRRRQAAAERKVRKENERRAQALSDAAAFRAENGLEWLEIINEPASKAENILNDLAVKLHHWGSLSEGQVELANKLRTQIAEFTAKAAEERANGQPVIEGRGAVSGEVVSCQWRTNDFGGGFKVLLKDDRGFKLWGTCPASIIRDAGDEPEDSLRGRRLTFVAKLIQSDDDEQFGFFSRPSKAAFI